MREKPISKNRKPTCMNITRMAATITQTVWIAGTGCPLSGVSMPWMLERSGGAVFRPVYRIREDALYWRLGAVFAERHDLGPHAAAELARIDGEQAVRV